MIVDGLRDAGEYEVTVMGDVTGLARRVAALAPDVVLIDLESPDRDVLDALTLASSRPTTQSQCLSSAAWSSTTRCGPDLDILGGRRMRAARDDLLRAGGAAL